MKQVFRFLFVAVIIVAGFEKARATDVSLAWDASSSSGAAGYYVYYGTTSGFYSYKVDAGDTTSVTLTDLIPGVTYYIAATSYDENEDESSFSSELSYTVPVDSSSALTLTMMSGPSAGGPASLQFQAQTGHWYEIQATTDFVNWASVWQSAVATIDASMQFTDPDAGLYSSRFYRLVLH